MKGLGDSLDYKGKLGRVLKITVLLLLVAGVIYFFVLENNEKAYQELIIGRTNDAISLDPAIITDSESFEVTVNIYETLVKLDRDAQNVLPGLAESWSVSEDGLTWTFKIRKGVVFHDNYQLDAKAVAFNFHRWMNIDSPYHTGQFTYWSHSFNGFPGIVQSVTALSDTTLEIILNEPFAPFLSVLSMPAFGISSPNAIITYNEGLREHPVGTGPFKFKSWEKGQTIQLEKNENYWQVPTQLDAVIFRQIQQHESAVSLLATGEIHIANNLSVEDVQELSHSQFATVHYRPFMNIGYLALNNQSDIFKVPEVRKAVNILIDRELLLNEELDALTKSAHSFLPPLLLGYHEGIQSPEFDLERAKKLLKSAGYPNGFQTTLWVMDKPRNYFSSPVKLAEYIKKQLALANIDVEIKVFKWEEYSHQVKEGRHQMALAGWNGDIADPDNFLNTLFSSEKRKEELVLNYAFYKNEQVDFLLTQARRTTDIAFRKSLYRESQELLADDCPSVPLVHTMTAIGVSNAVKGFEAHITGMEEMRRVELVGEDE